MSERLRVRSVSVVASLYRSSLKAEVVELVDTLS
jgi:hypothetical protein